MNTITYFEKEPIIKFGDETDPALLSLVKDELKMFAEDDIKLRISDMEEKERHTVYLEKYTLFINAICEVLDDNSINFLMKDSIIDYIAREIIENKFFFVVFYEGIIILLTSFDEIMNTYIKENIKTISGKFYSSINNKFLQFIR